MGPTRTTKTPLHAESSSSGAGRTPNTNSKPKRYHGAPAPEPETTPGVQKIKASLRQTRRLLAKDKLAADVRVETERRLKALEADLAQAELTKKEKALAVRYHKIKFFERQKVVRKLNQTQKRLETDPSAKEQLEELRVDLNYILHYPKTKKYISLFPPEVRKGKDEGNGSDEDDKADSVVLDKAAKKEKKLKEKAEKKESQKTDTEREEVKVWVREQMKKGVFSGEPELHLDARTVAGKRDEWSGDVVKGGKGKKGGKAEKEQAEVVVEEGDAFFGDDDDEEDDKMDEAT